MRFARLSLLSLVLSAIFINQSWFEVKLNLGKTISITGSEATASLMPLISVALLGVSLGLYLKTRSSIWFLSLAFVCGGIAVWMISALVAANDASAASASIAKSTGVVGWLTQRETIVSSWTLTLAVGASALCLVVSLSLLVLSSIEIAKNAPKKSNQRAKSAKKTQETDLWKETSI